MAQKRNTQNSLEMLSRQQQGIYPKGEQYSYTGETQGNAARKSIQLTSQANNPDLKNKLNDTLYKRIAKQVGITNFSSWNDVKRVEDFLAKGGGSGGSNGSVGGNGSGGNKNINASYDIDRATGGTEKGIKGALQSQGNEGNKQYNEYEQRVDDLNGQINQLKRQNQGYIEDTTRQFSSQLDEIRLASDAQIKSLNDLLLNQRSQFESAFAQQNEQLNAANLAYQSQMKLTENLSRAFVPASEKTAAGIQLGDQRSIQTNRQSSKLADLTKLNYFSAQQSSSPAQNAAGLMLA